MRTSEHLAFQLFLDSSPWNASFNLKEPEGLGRDGLKHRAQAAVPVVPAYLARASASAARPFPHFAGPIPGAPSCTCQSPQAQQAVCHNSQE